MAKDDWERLFSVHIIPPFIRLGVLIDLTRDSSLLGLGPWTFIGYTKYTPALEPNLFQRTWCSVYLPFCWVVICPENAETFFFEAILPSLSHSRPRPL